MSIIAIPMQGERPAPHVAKAPELLLVNEQGQTLQRLANPAAQTGCRGKQALLTLLQQHGVQTLRVRRIGQHMLARMLAAGLTVERFTTGWKEGMPLSGTESLTDAAQGAPSRCNGKHQCHSSPTPALRHSPLVIRTIRGKQS